MNKFLIVTAFLNAAVTALPQSRETIEISWNRNSARGCDFVGNDLMNMAVPDGKKCAEVCSATTKCTHYTWSTWESGTCFLKEGPVKKEAARAEAYSSSMVCGFNEKSETVTDLSPPQTTGTAERKGTEDLPTKTSEASAETTASQQSSVPSDDSGLYTKPQESPSQDMQMAKLSALENGEMNSQGVFMWLFGGAFCVVGIIAGAAFYVRRHNAGEEKEAAEQI